MSKLLSPLIILYFVIFLYSCIQVKASENLDSTGTLSVATMPDDAVKVKKLLQLADEMSWTDIHQAESYATQALRISEKLNYQYGLAHSKYKLALFLKDSDFRITEDLILESLEHARQLNDSTLIGSIYNTIGNLKDNVNERDDAVKYYLKALEIFNALENDSLKGKVYNNLGIIHDDMEDYGQAYEYYSKAAELNRKNGNFSGLAINYLNIGYSFVLSGDLERSYEFLQMSYDLATEHDYQRILPYIYDNLSNYYYKSREYKKAVDYARKAETLAREQMNLLLEKQALISMKEAYFASKDLMNAYQCLQKINLISDSIYNYNKLKEIDLLELKYAFEKERRQQELESELLKAEIHRKELTLILILVLTGLVVLFFFLIYFIQNNRIRRKNLEQKNILLEKEKLGQQLEFKEKELEFKNKELTTNVMYLLKKNEFISNISDKLKNTSLELNPDGNEAIGKIILELDRSVSEDNWTDFEVRFQEVHVDFYNKLSKQYPDLTPNELRLCAFLKLNMTSKEIAGITYQSVDSLKVARHRLRKKLSMDRDENLIAFLTQL